MINRSWSLRSSNSAGMAITVTIIVVLVVVVWAANYYSNYIFRVHAEPVDMETVSRRTDVAFPPNAKLLNSLGIRHGIDFELYAKVEIGHNDVESFVAALKKDTGIILSRKDRMYLTNSLRNWRKDVDIPEWWKPDSSQKFIACYSYMPMLLISLDDSNKAVIWVHWDTDGPPSSIRRK